MIIKVKEYKKEPASEPIYEFELVQESNFVRLFINGKNAIEFIAGGIRPIAYFCTGVERVLGEIQNLPRGAKL